jgi:hypothetical protein
MADELTRSIKIPISDGLSLDMELPTAAARANSFLAFDATGEPTVVTAGSPGAPTTMTRQQFSGTGAQVAFTLASDPGALGNSCEVFIGGIYQQRDTYTIAGTTLTFTAAPVASTNNIEVVNFLTSAIGTTDSALVTYVPAGTGATQRTVQAKLRDTVSVKDFGAVGDGVADDTAAIQAALNTAHSVFLPQGTYKITSQLVFGASCSGLVGEGMYLSVISKTFNGNAILCDTSGAVIQNLGINGNGATYTDGGIVPRGYNILIQHCRINDTADSPIKVAGAVGSNALAATYLRVDNCFLSPTNIATTYAIRSITSDDSERPTCRVFSNLSGGSSLVDFSGMNYAVLENSLGTIIKFDSNSSKIVLKGNRFTVAASNLTIYGNSHVIDGNVWGFGVGYALTIDSTAANVFFGPNNNISIGASFNSSVVQNQAIGLGNGNTVYSKLLSNPTLPWLGSTTNPTIGNGSFTAYYEQDGRLCNYTVGIIINTTTSVGSGTYSFQLPFKALVTANGVAMVKSSAGVFYQGFLQVSGSSSVAYIYLTTLTPSLFASTSLGLGTNATIDLSITYQIAVS